jgi:hypothetical protein
VGVKIAGATPERAFGVSKERVWFIKPLIVRHWFLHEDGLLFKGFHGGFDPCGDSGDNHPLGAEWG